MEHGQLSDLVHRGNNDAGLFKRISRARIHDVVHLLPRAVHGVRAGFGERGPKNLDLGVFRRLHRLRLPHHIFQHDDHRCAGCDRVSRQRRGSGRVHVACQRDFVRGPRVHGRTQLIAFLINVFEIKFFNL